MDSHFKEVGLTDVRARDVVDVVMGYTGDGYAHSTREELGNFITSLLPSLSPLHSSVFLLPSSELIVDVCSTTGLPLDPEFCVKGVRGMLGEMKKNPERFAGRRVLFIHSGTWPL